MGNPGIASTSVVNAQPALILPGTWTFATLPSLAKGASGVLAFASDVGMVYWDSSQWVEVVAGIANANNGQTEVISPKPQPTAGLTVNSGKWYVDTGFGNFTGNLYNDPVIAIGYNVSATLGITQTAAVPDPFSVGVWLEADYQFGTGFSGTTGTVTASGSNSTTVLVDTSQTWNVNQWAQWVLYNSTSGGRSLIISNTANTLTTSAVVGSDGLTPARANQTGDSYSIFVRQIEQYFEVNQNTLTGQVRRIRPIQVYLDKGTMQAQGALGAAGIIALGSPLPTAGSSPRTFTSSLTNHGLPAGTNCYVRLLGLTGGTWNTLNGKQFPATVTAANTFTLPINTGGLGTCSGGSYVVEPIVSVANPPQIILEPFSQGLQISLASWVGTNGTLTDTGAASDVCYLLIDSKFTMYGRQGVLSNQPTFQIIADTGGAPAFAGWTGGSSPLQLFQLVGNENSTSLEIDTWTTSGTGAAPTFSFYRPNTTDVACTLGSSDQGYVQGLFNVSNKNQTASRSLLNMKQATSQTGDYIDCWDSTGNTTKKFMVNSSGAIGVNSTAAPAQVTGWGTPVGNAVIASYNITDAGGANSNTNKALAQIISDLKAIGFYAT